MVYNDGLEHHSNSSPLLLSLIVKMCAHFPQVSSLKDGRKALILYGGGGPKDQEEVPSFSTKNPPLYPQIHIGRMT